MKLKQLMELNETVHLLREYNSLDSLLLENTSYNRDVDIVVRLDELGLFDGMLGEKDSRAQRKAKNIKAAETNKRKAENNRIAAQQLKQAQTRRGVNPQDDTSIAPSPNTSNYDFGFNKDFNPLADMRPVRDLLGAGADGIRRLGSMLGSALKGGKQQLAGKIKSLINKMRGKNPNAPISDVPGIDPKIASAAATVPASPVAPSDPEIANVAATTSTTPAVDVSAVPEEPAATPTDTVSEPTEPTDTVPPADVSAEEPDPIAEPSLTQTTMDKTIKSLELPTPEEPVQEPAQTPPTQSDEPLTTPAAQTTTTKATAPTTPAPLAKQAPAPSTGIAKGLVTGPTPQQKKPESPITPVATGLKVAPDDKEKEVGATAQSSTPASTPPTVDADTAPEAPTATATEPKKQPWQAPKPHTPAKSYGLRDKFKAAMQGFKDPGSIDRAPSDAVGSKKFASRWKELWELLQNEGLLNESLSKEEWIYILTETQIGKQLVEQYQGSLDEATLWRPFDQDTKFSRKGVQIDRPVTEPDPDGEIVLGPDGEPVLDRNGQPKRAPKQVLGPDGKPVVAPVPQKTGRFKTTPRGGVEADALAKLQGADIIQYKVNPKDAKNIAAVAAHPDVNYNEKTGIISIPKSKPYLHGTVQALKSPQVNDTEFGKGGTFRQRKVNAPTTAGDTSPEATTDIKRIMALNTIRGARKSVRDAETIEKLKKNTATAQPSTTDAEEPELDTLQSPPMDSKQQKAAQRQAATNKLMAALIKPASKPTRRPATAEEPTTEPTMERYTLKEFAGMLREMNKLQELSPETHNAYDVATIDKFNQIMNRIAAGDSPTNVDAMTAAKRLSGLDRSGQLLQRKAYQAATAAKLAGGNVAKAAAQDTLDAQMQDLAGREQDVQKARAYASQQLGAKGFDKQFDKFSSPAPSKEPASVPAPAPVIAPEPQPAPEAPVAAPAPAAPKRVKRPAQVAIPAEPAPVQPVKAKKVKVKEVVNENLAIDRLQRLAGIKPLHD